MSVQFSILLRFKSEGNHLFVTVFNYQLNSEFLQEKKHCRQNLILLKINLKPTTSENHFVLGNLECFLKFCQYIYLND